MDKLNIAAAAQEFYEKHDMYAMEINEATKSLDEIAGNEEHHHLGRVLFAAERHESQVLYNENLDAARSHKNKHFLSYLALAAEEMAHQIN